MDKNQQHIEKLKSYLLCMSPDDRDEFAIDCNTSYYFLRNVMYGTRKPSAILSVKIENLTKGEVTRKDLRPDDWFEIWPELARAEIGVQP